MLSYELYYIFSSIESAGGKSGGILDVCVIRDSISRFSGAGIFPPCDIFVDESTLFQLELFVKVPL